VPDLPVVATTEVPTPDAATEANDIVMAEVNASHDATPQSEAPEATEDLQPSSSDVATTPPVPHTMARAFNREGELISIKWPIMMPPIAPGP
jgi:hypothetical protein